jgi:hypothetical protein
MERYMSDCQVSGRLTGYIILGLLIAGCSSVTDFPNPETPTEQLARIAPALCVNPDDSLDGILNAPFYEVTQRRVTGEPNDPSRTLYFTLLSVEDGTPYNFTWYCNKEPTNSGGA